MLESINRSVEYSIEELLVSRTDERGVILSANEAFQKVAGYEHSELINAPHKIVRHEDMPKGVFWRLWDSLKAGRPIGAYVKNKTKSGQYYWVFAIVTPLEGGHMSMRIKPNPERVKEIEKTYAQMRSNESSSSMLPEESFEALGEVLENAGFQNYEDFMAGQLAANILDRNAARNAKTNVSVKPLRRILKIWQTVSQDCKVMFSAYDEFKTVPMNMQIQAGHLEDEGAALSVIASNFATIASQINNEMSQFATSVRKVNEKINDALFMVCVQDLLEETHHVLAGEGSTEEKEFEIIHQQKRLYCERTTAAIKEAISQLSLFFQISEVVKRNISGLSVTRVMCAIENVRFADDAEGSVSAIIEELRIFQDEVDSRMRNIDDQLRMVNRHISQLKNRALAVAA